MRWLSESVDTLVERECGAASSRTVDVVVVGSGYGGAVAALRLATAGIRVVLLERGKEYGAGEFPEGFGTAVGHMRLERDAATHVNGYESGLFDIRTGDGIGALVGNALGGTSQINANVILRPDPRVFEKADLAGRIWPRSLSDRVLTPWYERAGNELGAEQFSTSFMDRADPDRGEGTYGIDVAPAKFTRLQEMAERLGQTAPMNMTCRFEPAQLAVRLGQVDAATTNTQPVMSVCAGCGDCVSGCNYNAKKTLAHSYLPRAKAAGAAMYTGVSVLRLSKEGDEWLVHFVATDTRKAQRDGLEVPTYTLRARNVVLAAGTFGSTEILLRSQEEGVIEFSQRLGKRFSTNGDNLSFDHMLDRRVNGVGVGDSGIAEEGYAVGPTITGMIKIDHKEDVTRSVLIQDGAVPGAIAGLFHQMITTSAAAAQLEFWNYRGLPTDGAQTAPITDWASLASRGLSHTQTLLTMGHDESAGEIMFDKAADRLRIHYCSDESQRVARIQMALLAAGRQGGFLIQNPVLQPLPEGVRDVLSGPSLGGGTFTVHPLGGCCMGDDATRGVVDDCGRVFKSADAGGCHAGLYVLDGSVVATSLGANPLLTITALAERAIDALLKSDFLALARSPSAESLTQPPAIDKTNPAAVPRSVPVRFSEALRSTAFFWKAPADGPGKALDGDHEVACDAYLLLHLPVNSLEAFAADPQHRVDIPGPGLGWTVFDDDALSPRLRLDRKPSKKSSPSDRPDVLAHLSVVGGSVCLLPVIAVPRWRRCGATVRAGLTWWKERGSEEVWQSFIGCLTRFIECLTPRKDQDSDPGPWKRFISLCKLARHASEERTMEYRLSLRETLPEGVAPREYVLVGTKRVGFPASWPQLIRGIWPGRTLGRTNVWRAFGQMDVTLHEDGGRLVGHGQLALDMLDMTRMHAPQLGMRANTPDALVALAGYPLWMFRLLLKTRLWDFRLPDYPEDIPKELYEKDKAQQATEPKLESRWPDFPKVPSADREWPTPWPAFPSLRVRGRMGHVKACEPVSLHVQRSREFTAKDVELKLIRYRNTLEHEPSGRHDGVRQFRTLLMLNGFAQSTLGFVPQEHHRDFDHPTLDEPGLAEFFYEQGFDVWLFDYRTSSILDASKKACSMDDIAEFDIPAAVDHILETLRGECPEAGQGDLQIYAYAHCVGAASLAMSLLGGYLQYPDQAYGKLAGVTFSQMQAFLVGSRTAQMRLQVGGILRDALGIEYLRLSAAERQPTALESVLDRLFASLPVDPGEHCPHEFDRFTPRPGICTCKRMSGTISRLLKHDRIKEETHDRLAVYFGRANTSLLVHGGRCVENERLVNADGQNVYVTDENIRRYLHLPVAILHGDENALFDVESAYRTVKQLARVNIDLKPRAIIAKGFAHFDCTIGHGPDMHAQILDPMRHFYGVAWEWNNGADVDPAKPEAGTGPESAPAEEVPMLAPAHRRSHARMPLAGPVIGWTRRKSGEGPPAHLVRVWIEVDETQADRACAVATRVGVSGPATRWDVRRIPLNASWNGAPPPLDRFAAFVPQPGEPYVAIGLADVEVLDSQLADERPLTISMFSVHEFDLAGPHDPLPDTGRSIAPPVTPGDLPDLIRDGKMPLGGHSPGLPTALFSRNALAEMDVIQLLPKNGDIPEPEVHALIESINLEQSLGVARALQADPRTLSRKMRLEPLTAGYVAAAAIHKPALQRADQSSELRFVASCCRYPGLGFERDRADASLKEMVGKMESGHLSPQFMLMLGDQIYADATAGLMDSPSAVEKVMLATRRAFASGGFRALTSRLPTYMVIDDHEISDNWSTDELDYRAGATQARAAALRLRDTAFSTFTAYQWAHSPRNVAAPGFNYRFDGPGSSFFVLDTRSNRLRHGATPQVCSQAQLDALGAWLNERPDDVKFIVTSSVVVPGLREHQRPDGVPARAADTWQLAPDQRRQLLALVACCASRDVVFISGDYHCSAISTLSFSTGRTAYAVVTPPLYAPIPAANVHPREILPVEDIALNGGVAVTVSTQAYAGLGFAEMALRQSAGEKWFCVNLHQRHLDASGAAARHVVSRHLPLARPR